MLDPQIVPGSAAGTIAALAPLRKSRLFTAGSCRWGWSARGGRARDIRGNEVEFAIWDFDARVRRHAVESNARDFLHVFGGEVSALSQQGAVLAEAAAEHNRAGAALEVAVAAAGVKEPIAFGIFRGIFGGSRLRNAR